MQCLEDGVSYVFTVDWHRPPPAEGIGRAEFAARQDCPAAAGLSGALDVKVHSGLPGVGQVVGGVAKLWSAGYNLSQKRLDKAFDVAADGLDELVKLADLRTKVDLTVRFHAADGQPSTPLRVTGRAASPLADTDRAVKWDDFSLRTPGSPALRRAVLTLSLPPIPR
ncbi:hypothetical protein [Streptomyces olivochromogenes]|uniref:hypothetical protein n=1 Tax=Streptomyces olivochromogenes TaxID=1963 RepID=UPI001F4376EC|nr:hypothetical protein [Streptomyces olivochromogenes]MCF3136766.1 hypothetical protein [Streptomyces olivochromogenes]